MAAIRHLGFFKSLNFIGCRGPEDEMHHSAKFCQKQSKGF